MPTHETARKIGLARALSKLGYCSRSQAAQLIRGGRVGLNGGVRRDPETPVHLIRDQIMVDGLRVEARQKIYLMMNKPRGLVTTTADEKGRKTVYEALRNRDDSLPWVAPVGRLDKASEGLLLLTNDSEWGARIAAPETHLEKIYHVQVGSVNGEELAEAMTRGVRDEQGVSLCARRARMLRSGEKNCWIEIVLDEGRNRQIRRMLAALGVKVLRLVRVAIGPLQLGDMAKGTYRALNAQEKRAMDRAIARKIGR
ncbi:MAG TPA: pseudouridine synthase [Terriglobales bacterium]|nr:pseudouridine synthase [Terriglobales bacterium]